MNSLEELNGYASDLELPYTDLRSPDVLFNAANPTNQSQTVDEGFSFNSKVGIEITEVVNGDTSTPTYTIDVSTVPGTTVSWSSLPTGVTVSNPSSGVYVVSGIREVSHWTSVKYGSITMPTNYYGLWTYTSTISYYSGEDGNQSRSWTTAVTVNDVQFLTTPLEFVYSANTVNNITNTPQIADLDVSYPGVTWTVVGTPTSTSSIDTWTTTGTGGTFSVNATTKVFTISGTRAQVNSRLSGLQLDSNGNSIDFALSYVASNSLNSTTDTKIQLLSSVGLVYLGAVTSPSVYFLEDAASTSIAGAPLVTDSNYDGTGTYTYTVTPGDINAVTSMSTTNASGTSSFNPTTKVLTLTGTRSVINARLSTLTIVTSIDWSTDFTLSYTVVTPRLDTATKIQVLLCGSNDTEVSNMNISRTYVANNDNILFTTNVPTISDLDTRESTYTISFAVSSSLGSFGFSTVDNPQSTLTFSGTRAQCDAKFAALRFWPVAGVSSNGTFTYTQLKNGVQQVSQSVGLIGTAGTYSNARLLTFLSGQTWTPNVSDYLYANFELFLLGGGGGGSYAYGGGGGAQIVTVQNLSFSNTAYTITVGAGGAGGTSVSAAGGAGGASSIGTGHTASGGNGAPAGTRHGAAGSGTYAGTGGLGGVTAGNVAAGGGGGAGGGGYTGFVNQNGGNFNASSAYGGSGGQSNGYLWDGIRTNTALYANGGGGGSQGAATSAAKSNAGKGATSADPATSGTAGYGSGGGGGSIANGRPGGAGGSGRVMLRIYSK